MQHEFCQVSSTTSVNDMHQANEFNPPENCAALMVVVARGHVQETNLRSYVAPAIDEGMKVSARERRKDMRGTLISATTPRGGAGTGTVASRTRYPDTWAKGYKDITQRRRASP